MANPETPLESRCWDLAQPLDVPSLRETHARASCYHVRMSSALANGSPEFPEPNLNLVSVKEPVVGRIASNDSCLRGKSASFVRHTVIDVSGTRLAGHFRVGQAFGVIPPGNDESGKPHKVRLYSLACPTGGETGDGNGCVAGLLWVEDAAGAAEVPPGVAGKTSPT